MQTVQADIRLAQYQRENEEMKARLERLEKDAAQAQRESRLAKYERDLTGLLGQGYNFDLAEEMKDCADLAPDQFGRHCERIKKNYQKGPVGTRMIKAYPGPVEGKVKDPNEVPEFYQGSIEEFESDAFEKKLDYMRKHDLTGEDGWDKMENELKQKKTG